MIEGILLFAILATGIVTLSMLALAAAGQCSSLRVTLRDGHGQERLSISYTSTPVGPQRHTLEDELRWRRLRQPDVIECAPMLPEEKARARALRAINK